MSGSPNKQDILKMGNMLLEGWKMLSEGCPICATAIMSKNGNMRCPKCDLPIVLESSLDATQQIFTENPVKLSNGGSSPPPPTTDNKDSSTSTSAPNPSFQSLEQAKKEYDQQNRKQQDSVSGLIGQYMLKGWTLLGAQCPLCVSTPLMSQSNGPKYCVLCKEQVLEPDDEADEKSSSGKRQEEIASRFDMSQIPVLDPDMSGRPLQERSEQEVDALNSPMTLQKSQTDFVDKWSQEISSKLLCGWMLLDEVCVRAAGGCHGDLPLLKDLAGQKCCVKCGYQHEPPIVTKDKEEDSVDFSNDIDDDDEDLNDEMAIKIQMMTNSSFANSAALLSAPPASSSSSSGVTTPAHFSSPPCQVQEAQSESPVALKTTMYAHIDKKLKVTASRLDSEAASSTEALQWAQLITALAEARRAVKNM